MGNPRWKEKVKESTEALIIMQYIKKNQNSNIGLTMDRVAKVMHERGVCSRITTLKIINSLLEDRLLFDQKRKANEFHDLIVNTEYDFKRILKNKILYQIEEIKKGLEPFDSLLEDSKSKVTIKRFKDIMETLEVVAHKA